MNAVPEDDVAIPSLESDAGASFSSVGSDTIWRSRRLWAFYLGVQLLYTASKLTIIVIFCAEHSWYWFVFLIVLFLVDIYFYFGQFHVRSQVAAAGRSRRARETHADHMNAAGTSRTRSLERFAEGLPFAMFCLYAFSTQFEETTASCKWFFHTHSDAENALLQGMLSTAGFLAIIFMSLSCCDLDVHASSAVFEAFEQSTSYRVWHFVFRFSELIMRLTFIAMVCVVLRPLIGNMMSGLAAVAPVVLCLPVVLLWGLYVAVLRWANTSGGLPNDHLAATLVIAYVSLGVNPVFFLDRPGYKQPAGRARRALWLVRVVELAAVALLMLVAWSQTFPADCNLSDEQVGPWTLKNYPYTIGLILVASFTYNAILLLHPKFRIMLCDRTGESRVPLLSFRTGGQAAVQAGPPAGMSDFLVRLGNGELLGRLVPEKPVATNDFVVEKIIGQGNYGVVVLVRQERQDGTTLEGQRQRMLALKLQNTEKPDGFHPAIADPEELALRERSIYESVWSTRDPVTGYMGHPFILQLVCSCDWPEGQKLHVASTGKPVECVRDDGERTSTFHSALMMEYCPMGALDGVIRKKFRRGIAEDRQRDPTMGSYRWLELVRRFSGEILLALEYLHNHKIVYRDMKPENVLMVGTELEPHVKLGDFGFSKVVSLADPSKSLAGSPYFSAPEMCAIAANSKKTVTDSSLDIYSYGMLVFVMIYGVELHRKGTHGWKPVSVDMWSEAHEENKLFKWAMASALRTEPTPEVLAEFQKEARCPPQMAELVRVTVKARPSERMKAKEIRDLPLFKVLDLKQLGCLPHFDFDQLMLDRARVSPGSYQ